MADIILWSPGVTLDEVEKQVIKKAFAHYRSVKTVTANALGISVRTLDHKLEQYAEDDKRLEQQFNERKQRDLDFLARSRGISPEFPRHETQSATGISHERYVPVSESDGISELLPAQVTTFRTKRHSR